ncbi:lysosomal acid phosphatase-like [Homalodisca vitripennis]|uniref:lysosomal acid phosphatase-like n=1 Tax=Homalodisca vitripennis TaxID=197043 RepID=UPI001EEC0711|nr:lysosomal acid phosphatase-like [Homalodisca vitripennis]
MVSCSCFRCCLFSLALLCPFAIIGFALSLAFNKVEDVTPPDARGSRAVDTLKFVVVISRHGNRGSYFSFPNDPYPINDTNYWPYGSAELTTYGRVQMYNLGVKIRSLYNGFLDPLYYSDDFYASSTAVDRTLISGEAFLAGLFPPTGFQLWNKKILWQPVPIYSNSLDKTMVVEWCARFVQEQIISEMNYENENAFNLTFVNSCLNRNTGSNMSGGFGLITAWDTFISEETEGYVLPDWTKQVFPQPMTFLIRRMYLAYFAATDMMVKFVIGQFYKEMLGVMESKVNGTLTPNRKMYFYSGHDTSIVTLQAVLGIPKSEIIGAVKPGSAMLFELHQNMTTEDYFVEVLYIDGSSSHLTPVPIDVSACGHPCGFKQLVNMTQNFVNITNYEEECQI